MLADAVAAAKLEGLFDAALSVDPLRVFKTDRASTNTRSTASASRQARSRSCRRTAGRPCGVGFGLSVVWCNRYRQPRERLPGAPDFEIHSLAELPPLLGIG